jgi:zinc protease
MIYLHQSIPLTQIQIAFGQGSQSDPHELEGAAALAMDLIATGTQSLSRRAFESRVDAIGAHFGTSAVADYGLISMEVLSDQVDAAFALLEDVILNPAMDAGEFERLARLQRQEVLSLRDDDRAIGSRLFRQFLFRYAGYGRPTDGTDASLSRLSLADACAAYERMRAAPAALGVVSDLPRERFEAFAAGLKMAWTDTPVPGRAPAHERRPGLRVVLIDKPDRSQCQAFLGTGGPNASERVTTPLAVANTVLGASFTSRLMQEVRERRGLSYGVGSSFLVMREGGLFQARAFPNRDRLVETIQLMRQVIGDWIEEGVTAEELAFVQDYLANQFLFRLETPGMELYQRLVGQLIGRSADHLTSYLERLGAVTLDDARLALAAQFDGRGWYLGVVGSVDEAFVTEIRDAFQPDQLKVVSHTDELIA